MNWEKYSSSYNEQGIKLKVPEEIIKQNLSYAKPLFSQRIPIIFDEIHFSKLVGYDVNYIKRSINNTNNFYRYYKIPKKNGGKRKIAEPLPSLKEIQKWVLAEILNKLKVSRYAKAYVKKRSIKYNAKFHVNQKFVLTMDLKDFFGTINREMVYSIFNSLKYSNEISNILTSICILNGSIPQGAPTSPAISNIVLKEFDNIIGNYCIERNIRYTTVRLLLKQNQLVRKFSLQFS